jgi:hypothetical protein
VGFETPELIIYDVFGNEIQKLTIKSGTEVINIKGYSPGVYIAKIRMVTQQNRSLIVTRKIIKD